MGDAFNFRQLSGSLRYISAFIHFCIFGLAIGLFITCNLMIQKQKEAIGFLQIDFTGHLGTSFYTCGSFMIFLAVLGFYGIVKKYSGGVVVTYSLVAIISGIMGLWSGAIALYHTEQPKLIKDELFTRMDHYDHPHGKYVNSQQMWDNLQIRFKCCGIDDYRDWSFASCCLTTLLLPPTCCKLQSSQTQVAADPECGQNFLPDHDEASVYINTKGCMKPLLNDFNTQLVILGSMGISAGAALVFLAIFSCFLILTKRV